MDPMFDRLAAQHYDLIFATSFSFAGAFEEAAKRHPGSDFAYITGHGKGPSNFLTASARTEMAMFAAGILVGANTKTNRVGYVVPIPIPGVLAAMNMLYLGVQVGAGSFINATYVEQKVEVLYAVTGSFDETERAHEAAMRLHKLGCDALIHNMDDPTIDHYARDNGIFSVGQFNNMRNVVGESVLTSTNTDWGPLFHDVTMLSYSGDFRKPSTNRMIDWYNYQQGGPVAYEPSFLATPGSIAMFNDYIARMTSGAFDPACLPMLRQGRLHSNSCLSAMEAAMPSFIIDGMLDVYNGSWMQLPSEQCGDGRRHTVQVTHTPPSYEVTCIACTPGTHAVRAGVTDCTECPAGTFSGMGAANCTQCPKGAWSTGGSANCTACPAGTTNYGLGNTDCPVELSTTDYTLVIVLSAVFGGLLVLVALPLLLKMRYDRRHMNELYSEKAVAQRCAHSIAGMRLEEVDYIRHIEKPSEIIKALIVIMDNLVEYRRYLPQTLLVDQSDSDVSHSDSPTRPSNSSHDSVATTHTVAAGGGAGAHTVISTGVSRREASVLVVNVVSFLSAVRAGPDAAVSLHCNIADSLLALFDQTRGASETFNGDRFVATYNTARTCSGHRTAALKAMSQLQDTSALLNVGFSAAASSGSVHCGNIGCSRMRRFSLFGACVPWAFALERRCKLSGAANLTDVSIWRHEQSRFEMFAVDRLLCQKHIQDAMNVYLVTKEREVANEEWMYQLETSNSQADVAWNKWVAAVMAEDWDLATSLSAATIDAESLMFPQGREAFNRLVECFKKKKFTTTCVDHS